MNKIEQLNKLRKISKLTVYDIAQATWLWTAMLNSILIGKYNMSEKTDKAFKQANYNEVHETEDFKVTFIFEHK